MNFGEIWDIIRHGVRYDILLFSLFFGLIANIVRAYRWGLLVDSLGERFKTSNLVYAVLGNYAINFVLPRVGEVWRCGIITKYEKISFSKLLGTLVIDRMTDTLIVGLVTLLIFFFHFDFFSNFFARNPALVDSVQEQLSSAWLYIALALLVLGVWFTFARLSHLTLVQKTKGLLRNVWEGMKSVWLMEHKVRFLVQTFFIWALYFLFFYVTFFAFDFTKGLGLGIGLIAFTMSSIAVGAPVQGGIGAWHFMVIATLVSFGVKESDAAAFALVVHTTQSVWTALCGLFGIAALPLANKEKSSDIPI
jgi:uncharacterized protein (TIRG00374 family)